MDFGSQEVFLGCEAVFKLKDGSDVRGTITDLKITPPPPAPGWEEDDACCSLTLSMATVNQSRVADPVVLLANQIRKLRVVTSGSGRLPSASEDCDTCISVVAKKKEPAEKNEVGSGERAKTKNSAQHQQQKQGRQRSKSRGKTGDNKKQDAVKPSATLSKKNKGAATSRLNSGDRDRNYSGPVAAVAVSTPETRKCQSAGNSDSEEMELKFQVMKTSERKKNSRKFGFGKGEGTPEHSWRRTNPPPMNSGALLDELDDAEGISISPPKRRHSESSADSSTTLVPQEAEGEEQPPPSEPCAPTAAVPSTSSTTISGPERQKREQTQNVYTATSKEMQFYREKNICLMTIPSDSLKMMPDGNFRDVQDIPRIFCGRFQLERGYEMMRPIEAMLPEEKMKIFQFAAGQFGPNFWIRCNETIGNAVSQILMAHVLRRNNNRNAFRVLIVAGNNFQGAIGIVAGRYLSLHKCEVILYLENAGFQGPFIGTADHVENEWLHVVRNFNDIPSKSTFNAVIFGEDNHLSPTTTLHMYRKWIRDASIVLIEPPLIPKTYTTLIDKIRGSQQHQNNGTSISLIYAIRPSPSLFDDNAKIYVVNVATVPKYEFIRHFSFSLLCQIKSNSTIANDTTARGRGGGKF